MSAGCRHYVFFVTFVVFERLYLYDVYTIILRQVFWKVFYAGKTFIQAGCGSGYYFCFLSLRCSCADDFDEKRGGGCRVGQR